MLHITVHACLVSLDVLNPIPMFNYGLLISSVFLMISYSFVQKLPSPAHMLVTGFPLDIQQFFLSPRVPNPLVGKDGNGKEPVCAWVGLIFFDSAFIIGAPDWTDGYKELREYAWGQYEVCDSVDVSREKEGTSSWIDILREFYPTITQELLFDV